ncbi:MAG: cytochrome c biogenesis protein CcsA [Polyangiaceae bacterium]|nr:cytochrome c biogenesis protein CcsA [Polyangiaceae bacterium]
MTHVLSLATFLVAALLYGVASVLFFLDIARKNLRPGPTNDGRTSARSSAEPRLPPALLGIAAVSHLAYVTFAGIVAKVCPVNSVHFSLSLASILAVVLYLPARRRFRIDAIGVLLAPLGLATILGTFFVGQPASANSFGAPFLALHVLANLAGAALFMLAGGSSLLYLIQERRIKQKHAQARTRRLPPLEVLDKAGHRFLVAGFPLLTLGILTGTIWSNHLESGTIDEILRSVLGYTTWFVFATVLLLRAAAGFRGRRAAYGTITGLLCVAAVLAIYLVRPAIERVGG